MGSSEGRDTEVLCKSLKYFLCNPVDKQISHPKNRHKWQEQSEQYNNQFHAGQKPNLLGESPVLDPFNHHVLHPVWTLSGTTSALQYQINLSQWVTASFLCDRSGYWIGLTCLQGLWGSKPRGVFQQNNSIKGSMAKRMKQLLCKLHVHSARQLLFLFQWVSNNNWKLKLWVRVLCFFKFECLKNELRTEKASFLESISRWARNPSYIHAKLKRCFPEASQKWSPGSRQNKNSIYMSLFLFIWIKSIRLSWTVMSLWRSM